MFACISIRTATLVILALVFWSIVARPSGAHGPRVLYHVRPGDTLWSIAVTHYGGDPRSAVWQIETANHLSTAAIWPGETITLP